MNSDIESFHYQLLSITQDAAWYCDGLTDAQFNWRPAPRAVVGGRLLRRI